MLQPALYADYSDEDLMEFVQQDDHLAFNEIVKRYRDRLHNFLFRYTRNHEDCEDLVQETFFRVYKSKHSYTRIARLSTWMYTIAINLAKSMHKKKKRMPLLSIHKDDSDPNSHELLLLSQFSEVDHEVHIQMGVQQLKDVMNKVNEEFREVIYLRDFEEMTYEEIAEITDLPMGTVKSRINRGRAQIQSLMKEYVKAGTF